MTTVTTNDPKYLDGEPHEVAAYAGRQLEEALALTEEALEGFRWAAKGAWLSSEEYRTGTMPSALSYEDTPQGQKLIALLKQVVEAQKTARILVKAASYDPRAI